MGPADAGMPPPNIIGERVARGPLLDIALTAFSLHGVMLDISDHDLDDFRACAKAGFRAIGHRRQATLLNDMLRDLARVDSLVSQYLSSPPAAVCAPDAITEDGR